MRYDVAKDSCILPFAQFPRESVQSIGEDKNGTLWFGIFGKPLIVITSQANAFMSVQPFGSENSYYMHSIPNAKGVWLSPLLGADQSMQTPRLVTLDTTGNTFTVSPSVFSVSTPFLRGIDMYPFSEDERGAWYVRVDDYAAGRCENGLYRIQPHISSGLSSASSQALDSTLFREQIVRGSITAFCRDPRTGVVCVGVKEQGVTVLIPTGMERLGDHNGLGDVISLHTDKRGRIWCGTYKGLYVRTNGDFVAVSQVRQSQVQQLRKPQPSDALPIYDIQETSTGTILVASVEGLFRYDEASKTLHTLPALIASIGKTTIRSVRPDPLSKEFWINVSSVGMVRCREDGSPLAYFTFGQSLPGAEAEALGTSRIFTMQFDRNGDLWMGGMSILLRWRRQTGTLERLTALPNTTFTLQPTKLVSTENNSFIAALFGVGLGHINAALPSFTETFVSQYIRTAPINSRLSDVQIVGTSVTNSILWWTTRTNGIYRAKYGSADDTSKVLSLMQPELLLPSDENATKGSASEQTTTQTERGSNVGSITSDGKGGVVFDYYGDVLRADHTARAYTDTARVVPIGYFRNDSVMAGLPQHGDTLRCAYNGSFALSCAVVSLARPERHRLEYHLEGVDAAWNVMPDASLRTVRYSSLQPGSYILSIRTRAQDAYDDEALLSANMLTFTIDVPYPWWMHPITRAVGFLLLAAGFVWTGYTVQHRRTLVRLARLEREKELESVRRLATESQLQTLRLQMNPHFLYNVLAEIQHLVETGNELASHYIAIFSRLLDRVLRKAVNDFISVSDEIHILKQYIALEELRNAGRLQCYVMLDAAEPDATAFDADGDNDDYADSHHSDDHDTAYWQAREMPTFILQPFVENAIRHGIRGLLDEDWKHPRKGIIAVHLYEEGDTLRCVVEDNGVGREEAARRKAARPQKEHLSIATSVTQERLRLLTETFGIRLTVEYTDLYDESGVPAGTMVTVIMPLRKVPAPDVDLLPQIAP